MKNTIRQYSLPGYELRDYTTEAIAFLRDNEPPEGFFVGFSGGKDSIEFTVGTGYGFILQSTSSKGIYGIHSIQNIRPRCRCIFLLF